jgi:hypothetical protein
MKKTLVIIGIVSIVGAIIIWLIVRENKKTCTCKDASATPQATPTFPQTVDPTIGINENSAIPSFKPFQAAEILEFEF